MNRKHWPNYISRTGARFATIEEFIKASNLVDTTDSDVDQAGIPLARLADNSFICSRRELHAFVVGDSGCGKTRRVIVPSIKLIAKSGESMIISDPKGELYKKTAKGLQKKGYKVKVINFRNPSRGSRWNPLQEIERLYRTMDQEKQDKAVLIFKDIVDIMIQDVKSEKDAFWENIAAKFIMGIAYLIIEHGEEGDLTFENIAVIADEIYEMSNNRYKKEIIAKYLESLDKSSLIKQNLSGFIDAPDKTMSSIYSVAHTMISAFTNQESLMDLFYRSDFAATDIGKEKTALYIVLPDDSEALYSIATLLVKQIYSALVELADAQHDGILPNRTVFLLDEFANFATIPSVDSMLTAARSRGMRFVLVCQSMEQLHKKYGVEGAEILLSNCRIWLYMSCRNYQFLKRLEELAGNFTSPYTGQSAPLISVDEMQHFEMGTVLSFNDRCRPMKAYLPDYSEYDFGEDNVSESIELPEPRAYEKRMKKTFEQLIGNTATISRKKQESRPVSEAAPTASQATAGVPKSPSVEALLKRMNEKLGKPAEGTQNDGSQKNGAAEGKPAQGGAGNKASGAAAGSSGAAAGSSGATAGSSGATGTDSSDPFDWWSDEE